jgi:DNA primase
MNYDRHQIERVKEANPIERVIADDLELRRSGASYVANCPWCEGKKKFTVNPNRQTYKCWKCDAFGDVVKWLRERHGLTFPQAIERLIQRAGISV